MGKTNKWSIKIAKRINKRFNNSILNGARYFTEDGSQNYLLFQLVFKYFWTFTGTDKFCAWKSKGLWEKSIKVLLLSGNSFVPKLTFIYKRRIGAKFKGNCVIQNNNISFTHRNVVNLFIVFKLDT